MSTRSGTAIGHVSRVVTVGIRELGPTVSLLSSAALIDGGTEVVLQIGEIAVPDAVLRRAFAVHWRHGGPGVVKGVARLADDLRAALSAGLQPEPRTE